MLSFHTLQNIMVSRYKVILNHLVMQKIVDCKEGNSVANALTELL